jgi:probable rRNA maturation factor
MILNRQRSVRVSVGALESFVKRVRRELKLGEGEITICLVSDAEIAGMNERFRKKAGPTDVLSFPTGKRLKPAMADKPKIPGHTRLRLRVPLGMVSGDALGEIAIAPAVAQRNAKIYGRTFAAELKILTLHGILHLLGYDHEADRGEMYRMEYRLRKQLGLV